MINDLMNFINDSPTCFNACMNARKILLENGYIELFEEADFNIEYNKKYFICRNNSSIIAFNIPSDINRSINIIASHTDSPNFKIKPNFKIDFKGEYQTLSTEPYGGAIYSSWFDRPLSIAGRLFIKNNKKIEEIIINFNKNLLVIPNLCVHFNREINSGYKYNPEVDLKPLLSNKMGLYELIEKEYNIKREDILSFDLYVVNNEKSLIFGALDEFLMAPRIDNLASMYTSLRAFIDSKDTFKFFVSFDNEEVGSNTYQGAFSNFLDSILKRIYESLNINISSLYKSLSKSVLISADNAHAVHPNYPNKSDILNGPIMNKGLVIKYNANQSYTTSALSGAIFKSICDKAGVLYQDFTNRSDIRGGSTLGNILGTSVSLNMIDIGIPQLAMHSSYETCGINDIEYYYKAMKEYYNSNIDKDKNIYSI